MPFYKVIPASLSYKAQTPLVYQSQATLRSGKLVEITLRGRQVAGIVVGKTDKPDFKVKSITANSELPELPGQLIELAEWMTRYYASGLGPVTRQLVSLNSLKKSQRAINTLGKTAPAEPETLPPLTAEQTQSVEVITTPGTYILHGETGSGKTRVYLELSVKTLANDKSVVILTPEIGLTGQLEIQFKKLLNEQVIVLHSALGVAERRSAWQQILTSDAPLVIIGPRSALFAPLKNTGLIIIDEAHDGSYKQTDAPHYQATTVAAKLSQLYACPLVLGSATPSVNDYFLASERHRPILRMHKLAISSQKQLLDVALVDLRNHTDFKQSQYLSSKLIKAIELALGRGEQALLFLNRRGTARVVICGDCGWSASCPNCGLSLIYHGDQHQLRCHVCGYRQPALNSCPNCGSSNLNYKSIGTKAIEAEAARLFPKARIKRFDSDSPKLERLELLYDEVRDGKVDIIIGTQAVAKGLDLPKLSVVGVIMADSELLLPDFQADERTYQLLRQVIGRVGRGHRAGQVIVQTYSPDNPVIRAALKGDYASFFKRELAQRKKFNLPPSRYLLKLEIGRASAKSAETAAGKLKQSLTNAGLELTVDGPSPSFHEVRSGKYYQQLIVKSKSRGELVKVLASLPSGWLAELDPKSLL